MCDAGYALPVKSVQEKVFGAPAALFPDAIVSNVVAGVVLLVQVMFDAGRLHSACAACAGEGLWCPCCAEPRRFLERGGDWCGAAGQGHVRCRLRSRGEHEMLRG